MPVISESLYWALAVSGPIGRQDGKELFYLSAEGMMMAVKPGSSFEAGSPVALFQTHRRQPVSAEDFFSYGVSSDGQRFLILNESE